MAPEETTVTTTSTSDGDVLAEAAVASAAVSGAAIVTAQGASQTAEEADGKADAALAQAQAANAQAGQSVTAEEARRIAREESDRYVAELAEWAAAVEAQESQPSSEGLEPDDEIPDEVLPPSVKKAGGGSKDGEKLRFADRWNGRS